MSMKELLLFVDSILLILHAPVTLMEFSFKWEGWKDLDTEERMVLILKLSVVVSLALFATVLGVAIILKSNFLEPANDWLTWSIAYCFIILFFPAGAWGEDFELFLGNYKERGENIWDSTFHALRDTIKHSVKDSAFLFAIHFGKALIALGLWHLGLIRDIKVGLFFAFAIPPWIIIYAPILGVMFGFVCLFTLIALIIVRFFPFL